MIIGSGDFRYELADEWAQVPDGAVMGDVCDVDCVDDGSIYLFTRGTYPLLHLDNDGKVLDGWESGFYTRIHGGKLSKDGNIFCVDSENHIVCKHRLNGELIYCLGTRGVPNDNGFVNGPDLDAAIDAVEKAGPPFNLPTNLCCADDGTIYISDGYGNGRVHHFSVEGKLIESFGEIGRGSGQFRAPHCICQDRQQRFYVADRQNNRVQLFAPDFSYLKEWNDLEYPTGVAVDNDGIVYVSELARRISIFDPDGKLILRYRCEDTDYQNCVFVAPHGLSVDQQGALYIADVCVAVGKVDRGGRSVRRFLRI